MAASSAGGDGELTARRPGTRSAASSATRATRSLLRVNFPSFGKDCIPDPCSLLGTVDPAVACYCAAGGAAHLQGGFGIGGELEYSLSKRIGVSGLGEKAILARHDDLRPVARAGGHRHKAACHGFQQGQ